MSRSIVITGASKGTGRAAAEALAAAGWQVIDAARQALAKFPGQFLTADLSRSEWTVELASTVGKHGEILGIVNNVGITKHERFEHVNCSDFSNIMNLNVRPALQLTRALSARHAERAIWTHRERLQSGDARTPVPIELRCGEERARKLDSHDGR